MNTVCTTIIFNFFSKGQLETEGHVAVSHSDFFLEESSSSPLLIIIRNEDIAEHIFKVNKITAKEILKFENR